MGFYQEVLCVIKGSQYKIGQLRVNTGYKHTHTHTHTQTHTHTDTHTHTHTHTHTRMHKHTHTRTVWLYCITRSISHKIDSVTHTEFQVGMQKVWLYRFQIDLPRDFLSGHKYKWDDKWIWQELSFVVVDQRLIICVTCRIEKLQGVFEWLRIVKEDIFCIVYNRML